MANSSHVAVVLNGQSGAALDEEGVGRLRKAFADAGSEARVARAARGEDVRALVERAAASRPAAIAIGGGDGTLSTAAGVLVDSAIALGILPLGTLNHFARDLGIPAELEEAARTVAAGERAQVDVAEVNGRVFINNSSLGLYPSIVRRREILREDSPFSHGKGPALVWATLAALQRAPFLEVDLRFDGKTRHLRTPFLFVGNNVYTIEGLAAGKRERLEDACLSVHSTTRSGRIGLVALALRALFGRLSQTRDFESAAVQSLDVRSRRARLLVATDGELQVMQTPLAYRVRPRALTVIVPAAAKESAATRPAKEAREAAAAKQPKEAKRA
jgi:diacylglycerol kinase family enzyme